MTTTLVTWAVPTHFQREPDGGASLDQAMIITGTKDDMDRALRAVLERASATDRQLATLESGLAEERRLRVEESIRHSHELEVKRKRSTMRQPALL